MKAKSRNYSSVFQRLLWLLGILFFLGPAIYAQGTSNPEDSTGAPPADEDSASVSIVTDTSNSKIEYFDHVDNSPLTPIELREVPGRVVDSLKKDDAFWYADKAFRESKPAQEKVSENAEPPGQWMNTTMLVVIVVIFMALLGWYLFQANIIRRKQRSMPRNDDESTIEENIFDINYPREIERAEKTGNYRLAIRLLFLRLLGDLSRKNIIRYKHDKTNFDYLSELNPTVYYKDFFKLTRNYEYTWYGKFDVSDNSYAIIKNEFENFNRNLS